MMGAETPHTLLNFFSVGCCAPPCLGWKVETHMSLQSNDGLRVRNVEMKKFVPGWKRGTCTCMYGLRGPSINQFEFFLSLDHWEY